jgi:hypothetical protein
MPYCLTVRKQSGYLARMGRHDNRRSLKMRRRVSQKKLKARLKRRVAEKRPAKVPAPKPRATKKAAPKE